MNTFVCLISIALVIGCVTASATSSSSSSAVSNTNQDVEGEAPPANTAQINNEYSRFRKAAGYGGGAASGGYGGASIPAPPCPKNYLFSCQPNLAPVPCAAPSASYGGGSSGAYSAPVPTYVNPLGNNYGIPQTYGNFAPQPYSQFYGY